MHQIHLLSSGSTSGLGQYTSFLEAPGPFCPAIIALVATVIIISQDPLPVISSINPSRGLLGNVHTVTINGSNFGSNPSVNVGGSGVTGSVSSSTNSQITLQLSNTVTARLGNHVISVSTGSGTSNSKNFFVQKPTSLDYLSSNTVSDEDLDCIANNQEGFGVRVIYQVLDQAGIPITKSGLTPRESVSLNQGPFSSPFLPFATPQ